MSECFHDRREWFDRYREESLAGGRETLPYLSEFYTCPCCGYPLLPERHSHDICGLCWWEDDAWADDDELDKVSGPNRITLREGRTNFGRFLMHKKPHGDRELTGINDAAANANKRRAVAAFDAMLSAGTTDEIFALLEDAHEALQGNVRELKRWIEKNR